MKHIMQDLGVRLVPAPLQEDATPRDATHRVDGLSNSVRRAISILGLLNKSAEPLRFSDIQMELGMPKSSTSLLLSTLEALGYVTRDHDNRRYWLSPGLNAPVIPASTQQHAVTEFAMPILKSISAAICMTSFITVIEADQVLFLLKADGPNRPAIDIYAGRKTNAQSTAVGKVLLAYIDEEDQKRFIQRHKVIPHTKRTITSEDALLEELRHVRQVGYAIDDQEEALGVRCVAVPVFVEDSPNMFALGITGTLAEIRPDNVPSLARYLERMAQVLATQMAPRHSQVAKA